MNTALKKTVFAAVLGSGFLLNGSNTFAQEIKQSDAREVTLPNGWQLTPAGKMVRIGDLPLNIAVSPNGRIAAVTNNGYGEQSVQLVDIKHAAIVSSVTMGKAWLGLVFSDDGKYLYASGGNDNIIMRFSVIRGQLLDPDTIRIGASWPVKICIAGIALDNKRQLLYAVTKENNSLYVIDAVAKKVVKQVPLGGEGYACIISPDRKTLYVSCWGCDKIILFDTDGQKITGEIPTGDNPNEMCLTRDGNNLFVANANDNSVSVIDTRQGKLIEVLNTALYPGSPSGSTPNSVALTRDQKTLYIANADNNCLAVFDVSRPGFSKSRGFIPTGWYPTCVRVTGNKILVANGKGLASLPNPMGPNPARKGDVVVYQHGEKEEKVKVQYIAGLLTGTLGILKIPGEKEMGTYSRQVYRNTPYTREKELLSGSPEGNPVPAQVGGSSPIKHIFYIIKENRTYDQVLGDIKEGNGDPSLVLFGEKITPNQHAIAREFVLLDNFFVNGEVSADGHNWSMGAYATDYLEKTWPTSYSDRGGYYDSEGNREIANNKNGFFWDNCKRHGVSFRTYGEFMGDNGPNIPVLKDHFCKYFTPWDQKVRDTVRYGQWKRDFDSLLAINAVPQFNSIRFINDHTEGLSLNRPTPFAHAADNDLAVGLFLDHLSHSPIWDRSLVLIVEDDAQNGPDHVDAHRSTAYIAGGYVKQGFVDHTPYTTTSLVKTMELILGLPPMTQYDAASNTLWGCLNDTPGHAPFRARPINVDLNDKNVETSEWQRLSETFDFTAEDRVNDSQFNEVIWRAVKGFDSPCPPSVRAAFLREGKD
jgi:YVTN family beta-propeller protein